MLRRLMRTGLRKGMVDGSRTWLIVGAVAAGLRLLRRLTTRQPEIVYSQELRPGAAVVIAHATDRDPEVRARA